MIRMEGCRGRMREGEKIKLRNREKDSVIK